MNPLPPTFVVTRGGLHALACFVVSPARKARTGRIGLQPVDRGFGTPLLDDGFRLVVHGGRLVRHDGDAVRSTALTTLRDAAAFADVVLQADPGVGADLPPFEPDAPLAIDEAASLAMGDWYAFGAAVVDEVLADLPAASITGVPQLWPEHFDVGAVVDGGGRGAINVGCSPGDGYEPDPYLYVAPWEIAGLDDPFWNAPFGALVTRSELAGDDDPGAQGAAFLRRGLRLAGAVFV